MRVPTSLLTVGLTVTATLLMPAPAHAAQTFGQANEAGAIVVRGRQSDAILQRAAAAGITKAYRVKVMEYPDAQGAGGDSLCVAQHRAQHQSVGPRDCAVVIQASAGSPVAQAAPVHASAGAAMCPCVVRSRSWWQQLTGASWRETHKGLFYYDQFHAWFQPHSVWNKGYHRCNYGYEIGVAIDVYDCGHSSDFDPDYVVLRDRFKVSVIAKGVPIAAKHAMHVNVHSDGYIGYHWN